MPRDSGGNYTLPAGNPVVTGTNITAAWGNNTMNDIAAEVSDSLDRSGKGGMLAPLKGLDGAVGLPAYSFTLEPSTGFYRSGAGELDVAVLGTKRFSYYSDGRISGTGLHNAAGSVAGTTNQFIASGTYTPTLFTGTLVSSLTTLGTWKWIRVGNVVHVSGHLTLNFSNGGSAQFGFSLPIPSNFVSAEDLGGIGVARTLGGNPVQLTADATNDRGLGDVTSIDPGADTPHLMFQYEVL